MDLNSLRLFAVVVEEGSLSAAARKLDIPVSSISRNLVRFEEELGAQLLIRTTRQMKLTTLGQELYDNVAPLLASMQAEYSRLTEKKEAPAGELRITAPVELGQPYLADLVSKFLARYPGISVHAYLTNEIVDLVKEQIDIAIRFSGPELKDSALIATKASPLTGHLYASPSYLARKGTPRAPADLANHDWVIFKQLSKFQLITASGKFDVKPSGRASSNEILYVRELIRAGNGIGFLPAYLAKTDADAGTLVRVLPRASLFSGYVWLVRPAAKHTPLRVNVFRDFTLAYLKARPLSQD